MELVEAGRIRGLGVDVFPKEPYPELARGARVPGVLFSPHGAGYTSDLGRKVVESVCDALRAWRDGEPVPHQL